MAFCHRPMTDYAIETRGLGRVFGDVEAVRDLNLTLGKGEFFGLVGPDGAGKSTAIRLLCGILQPSSGDGTILGRDLRRDVEAIKARIGYLSQAFTLYGDLTVDENIEFFADLHGVQNFKVRRDELLAFTRLAPFHKRLAQALSGGMKKKLALACALIHTPEILLLDEPSTGVDPVSRGEFWLILKDLLTRGITIVMTTPYLDEAERCTRIGLMNKGTLIRLDTPDAIKSELRGRMLAISGGSLAAIHHVLKQRWPATALVRYGDRLHFCVHRGAEEVTEAVLLLKQNGIPDVVFTPIEPSLEDVFIALMSENKEEVRA
jgi:ABC-2 type transport system ATP-binding protein